MAKLQEIYFNDFVRLKRGYDLPNDQIVDGKYPVVASTSIKAFHKEYKVLPPSVVTGRSGSLGEIQFINAPCWPLNTALYVKNFNKNNPKYVYYFLRMIHLENFNSGAGVPTLNQNHLHKLKIKIHAKEEQQQIASILSAYDDLIETNNQRIATLEQLAQQIYKEWFVRMRFPGWEHTPLHHGMPEQWGRIKLGEISSFISRGITPIYDENGESIVINQKCIRNGRLNLNPSQKQSKEIPDNKKIQPNDVLINSTGEGTLGRVAIVTKNYDKHTVDTHVTIARPNIDKIDPTYYGFTLLNYQSIFEFMAVGATGQTELGRKDIMNVEIEVPIFQLQSRFASLAKPMLEQVDCLIDQNDFLTKTRNLLLPRLISGKLTLKQAEATIN